MANLHDQNAKDLLKFSEAAKKLGERIRIELKTREVSLPQLAVKLGISANYAKDIAWGKILPGPELAARLKGWMLGNETYEDRPLVRLLRKRRKKKYARVGILMPAKTVTRLSRAAAKVGYSRDSFITLAVNRLCDDEPTITTIKQAMAVIEHNLVVGALDRAPDILDILELDEEVLKEARKRKPTRKLKEEPFPLKEILNTPRFDGPANRIVLSDELEDALDYLDE